MDIEEFLTPVPYDMRWQSGDPQGFFIGDYVQYQVEQPVKNGIVLVSIPESRENSYIDENEDLFFTNIRQRLYRLVRSNWKLPFYDLGSISSGTSFEETCFALHSLHKEVQDNQMHLICLGGSQALSYVLFSSIQKNFINVGTVDIKLDIDARGDELTQDNHITKMILDENQRLLNYVNMGSQAPYNAAEEFDILEQLNFENIRLGRVTEDLKMIEPYVRELDFVSVDMSAMQSRTFSSSFFSSVNGFNEREICGIMRYVGLSDTTRTLHLSNFYPGNERDDQLIAEMLWYYIEAKNNQKDDEKKETYRVLLEDQEIIFLKSINSERWWLEVEINGKTKRVPCNEKDYKDCMKGEYPEQWLKFYKKFY